MREYGRAAQVLIVEGEPPLDARRAALYVPVSEEWGEDGWGLYDHVGRLLPSGAGGGRWTAPEAAERAAVPAGADEILVYAGLLRADLEGFVLGCFARLWSQARRAEGARLLFHVREPIEDLLAAPLVAGVLASLGIDRADCVAFDAPVWIERVVVPASAFETGRLAFDAVTRLASTVAIRLAGRLEPANLGGAPVHVSSALEPVPAFVNEHAFDQALAAAGVVVVHPSEMSFASLVTRVRAAPLLSASAPVGRVGSGVVASLFREAGRSLVLCAGETRAPDAGLIEAVRGHRVLAMQSVGKEADAAAYLRVMRRFLSVSGLPGIAGGEARRDLGPAGRCTCSDGEADASMFVGRPLTGRVQARIAGAAFPWWQIEWDEAVEVEEVVLHGPPDGEERATAVALLGSYDGHDWTRLAERDDPVPIGGIDGNALRWRAGPDRWVFRLLRVQSGTGALALDAIEILASAGRQAPLLEASEEWRV